MNQVAIFVKSFETDVRCVFKNPLLLLLLKALICLKSRCLGECLTKKENIHFMIKLWSNAICSQGSEGVKKLPEEATLHTTMGDITIKLFSKE